MTEFFQMEGIIAFARQQLQAAGIDSARVDMEILLSFVLGCSRSDIYLDHKQISAEQKQHFEKLLKCRLEGNPVQYLTGRACFFGLDFEIAPGVFIPRPETEILVQTVLEKVNPALIEMSGGNHAVSILDIGTGSGNIVIALTKSGVSCKILAIDISKEAVRTAIKNAQLHNVSGRIEFACIDCRRLDLLVEEGQLALIVSNPPYIRSAEIKLLDKQIQCEPVSALDGGPDGLEYYNLIVAQSEIYLKKDGYLVLEIGEDQAAAISQKIQQTGRFGSIEIVKDLNQRDRVLVARRII